ncbi:SPOR domain-containing protein [Cellvibrio sp. ARAG 10.3]|uniref:SPOR domain-containing protein n=1 Tax=Cellvibrio sp. ARAG 10.3 TaxID=3451358 RepID=UPI003F4621B5
MSRDYAKKNRAPNRRRAPAKPAVPGWVWLLIGGVLGAFIMFLVYLADVVPPPTKTQQPAPEKPKVTRTQTEEDVPKPRFDFYKLLQESEVIVPATEPAQTVEKIAQPQPDSMEYILQVGSFRNDVDADKLRAQLILLNLDARIEKVTIRNGELWHRVIVGPFQDQSRLASARSTLVANQYNALMLKRDKNAAP